jgi:uncharacterized membrane protein
MSRDHVIQRIMKLTISDGLVYECQMHHQIKRPTAYCHIHIRCFALY